jgi:3-deoxy-7-phosphoheptulonate synthase
MLVIHMARGCKSLEVARVCDFLERRSCSLRVVGSFESPYIVSNGCEKVGNLVLSLPGVKTVTSTKKPYPLASRETFPDDNVFHITEDIKVGGGHRLIMAGPCSVESRSQILETASGVKTLGANVLRGGAFKPRTNPYSFQGLGSEGINLLVEAKEKTGLPIVTEIMSPEDLEWLEPHVDILQIGARNMMNFALLKAVGRTRKPVLLKRGMMATVDEWLQAAEYILAGGNHKVILCERGIRSFDTSTRNTLDLSVVPLVKSISHLPVIVDPSHGTGRKELIKPMSMAAMAAGADGLMIEVHPRPHEALSDGAQSLTLEEFGDLMESVNRLCSVLDEEVKAPCGLRIAM